MKTVKDLYQWDINQKLIDCNGIYIDFPVNNEIYRIETKDGKCMIPDEFIQIAGKQKIWECLNDGTLREFVLNITARPKPPDYVFTPTERLTFEGLVQRVDNKIAEIQRMADSGELDGKKGDKGEPFRYEDFTPEQLKSLKGRDGHTPVKGTDYYTDEEKAEMLESVKLAFEPDVQAINQTAEQAKSIAKGRATGYVFDTLADLETALTDEEFVANLVLGDNFYIRATDVPDYWWDGTQKQKLEAEKPDLSGLVKDVQVNGTTVVADGIANIPTAKNGKYGVIRTLVAYGIDVGANGQLMLVKAENSVIDGRSSDYRAIVPQNLDYAVKAAMCDGVGAVWTAEERSAAWSRMSIIKTAMDEIAVAGAQYYLGEQTAVDIVFPDDAQIGQMITVSWYNGTTPVNLSITGTMLAFEYIPSANTRSEINALWDGTYWAVLGNEMEVPNDVA